MRIRFGEFVLDNEARTLERAGALVRLSPKAFELLEILISERPKAISKNELLERVWPDVVVEEENIKNLVWEIRGVLGDAGKDPRFLRTVQRFGYAFSGDAAEEGLRSSPGAQFWLYHRSSAFPLKPGELCIGRDPQCGIWIDEPGVSRQHARLSVSPTEVTIEDLGSKNGTQVGGTRIQAPTLLSDGDRIDVGSERLTFRSRSTSDATITERSRDRAQS